MSDLDIKKGGQRQFTKDAKHRFLSKLEQMAEELYRRGDSISHDDAWERQRCFVWGYGDAGKTINLVTPQDIQQSKIYRYRAGRGFIRLVYYRAVGSIKTRIVSYDFGAMNVNHKKQLDILSSW